MEKFDEMFVTVYHLLTRGKKILFTLNLNHKIFYCLFNLDPPPRPYIEHGKFLVYANKN